MSAASSNSSDDGTLYAETPPPGFRFLRKPPGMVSPRAFPAIGITRSDFELGPESARRFSKAEDRIYKLEKWQRFMRRAIKVSEDRVEQMEEMMMKMVDSVLPFIHALLSHFEMIRKSPRTRRPKKMRRRAKRKCVFKPRSKATEFTIKVDHHPCPEDVAELVDDIDETKEMCALIENFTNVQIKDCDREEEEDSASDSSSQKESSQTSTQPIKDDIVLSSLNDSNENIPSASKSKESISVDSLPILVIKRPFRAPFSFATTTNPSIVEKYPDKYEAFENIAYSSGDGDDSLDGEVSNLQEYEDDCLSTNTLDPKAETTVQVATSLVTTDLNTLQCNIAEEESHFSKNDETTSSSTDLEVEERTSDALAIKECNADTTNDNSGMTSGVEPLTCPPTKEISEGNSVLTSSATTPHTNILPSGIACEENKAKREYWIKRSRTSRYPCKTPQEAEELRLRTRSLTVVRTDPACEAITSIGIQCSQCNKVHSLSEYLMGTLCNPDGNIDIYEIATSIFKLNSLHEKLSNRNNPSQDGSATTKSMTPREIGSNLALGMLDIMKNSVPKQSVSDAGDESLKQEQFSETLEGDNTSTNIEEQTPQEIVKSGPKLTHGPDVYDCQFNESSENYSTVHGPMFDYLYPNSGQKNRKEKQSQQGSSTLNSEDPALSDSDIECDYFTVSCPTQARLSSDRRAFSFLQAANDGRVDQLRVLLCSGMDVNVRGRGDATALHRAARQGNCASMRMLLDWDADINAADDQGQTPLHRAACSWNVKAVRMLLECGADVDVRDSSGRSPLHEAAAWARGDALRELLTAGADAWAADKAGCTPRDLAASPGIRRLMDKFKRHSRVLE